MDVPRRGFLKSGALTAVSAGLVIGGARLSFAQGLNSPRNFQIPSVAEECPQFSFTVETFQPYVGDIFQVPNARGEMINLVLVDAENYQAKRALIASRSPELRSFSLTFHSRQKLPQFTSIHKVSHPALGEFDLFLTSNELKDGTIVYHAVFSHI